MLLPAGLDGQRSHLKGTARRKIKAVSPPFLNEPQPLQGGPYHNMALGSLVAQLAGQDHS